jgi:fructose-1,6-bisphosphatase/inositol monophosphatase family enzyme
MIDPDVISALIRRTAEAVILPRFRTLTRDQIREKQPGDLVTIADTEAETMLGRLLTEAVPGTRVCGEEGVACDRGTLALLEQPEPVWVIDPVDGTANFAHGRPAFAVIVALVEAGITRAGWLHDPLGNVTVHALAGGGAWCENRRLLVPRDLPLSAMTGSAYGRVPGGGGEAARLLTARGTVCTIQNTGCCGIDYIRLARGETHFKVCSGSLPWDHAAGLLIMAEAGAEARFLDGGDYCIHDHHRALLIAPTPDSWAALRRVLLEPNKRDVAPTSSN